MNEHEEREAFVKAALSYCGTPYHSGGLLKGVGIDCATLLICAARDANIKIRKRIEEDTEAGRFFKAVTGSLEKLPYYSPVWHLHRGGEKYLNILQQGLAEVMRPQIAGDIVLWRFGRLYSHSAIVVEWPRIVHAVQGSSCHEDNVDRAVWLKFIGRTPRPMITLSFWD